jgi:hypothetical protein
MNAIHFFILTTLSFGDRRAGIESTWGMNKRIVFYSDHNDCLNRIISASNRSDYRSAEEKNIYMLNHLISIRDLIPDSWLIFCDDDTYIKTENLKHYLATATARAIHCHEINKDRDPANPLFKASRYSDSFSYPSGGAGYVFHSSLLHSLVPFKSYETGFSDVSVGMNLKNQEIQLIHSELFTKDPPWSQPFNQKNISYHHVKGIESMKKVHAMVNDGVA